MTADTGLGLVVAAYFLGSVSFSFLIVRIKEGRDVRTVGSGNAGAEGLRHRIRREFDLAAPTAYRKDAIFDERAAHLVDDRHVLDPDRADLDAGHALHAGPERLRLDRADQLRVLGKRRFDAERGAVSHRALGHLP